MTVTSSAELAGACLPLRFSDNAHEEKILVKLILSNQKQMRLTNQGL